MAIDKRLAEEGLDGNPRRGMSQRPEPDQGAELLVSGAGREAGLLEAMHLHPRALAASGAVVVRVDAEATAHLTRPDRGARLPPNVGPVSAGSAVYATRPVLTVRGATLVCADHARSSLIGFVVLGQRLLATVRPPILIDRRPSLTLRD